MLYTLLFFSSKCSLVHNANLFGSCIIHVLYTGCAEIKKKNISNAKGLIEQHYKFLLHTLQVLYMYTLCDSTNINTIIEFVPNCL